MKVGKKILAVLCAVILCLGSMNLPTVATSTDSSKAQARAVSVAKVILKDANKISYIEKDYGVNMFGFEERIV